jgi:beta-glucanase (GH16 family)
MGAVFSIDRATHAPTIRTDNYIFFGRLDVEIQASPEGGIVTSAVLQSDDLDEIDWEWVGGDNTQVQSNYFSKGDTSTYDRGGFHTVDSPITKFHMYSIDWTPEAIQWIIDGQTVRTLKASDVGDKYPQTPMQVRLGSWTAGKEGAPQGTIDWSGGIADFSKGPFNAYYKSVTIVDYAGGSSATSKAVKEYVYGDKTGSAESIQIKLEDGSSGNSDDSDNTTTSSADTTTSSADTTTSPADTTTTSADIKTSSAGTTPAETTMKTAVPTEAASTTPADSTDAEETVSPSTVPTAGSSRNGMAIGGALFGVALAVAQLL